jgi:hypothetical protein
MNLQKKILNGSANNFEIFGFLRKCLTALIEQVLGFEKAGFGVGVGRNNGFGDQVGAALVHFLHRSTILNRHNFH